MTDARLLDRLAATMSRLRRLRLYKGLALGWIAGAIVAAVLMLWVELPIIAAVACGAVLAIAWGLWCSLPQADDLRNAAQLIEARYPELDSRLLTAVDLEPQGTAGLFGYLQMVVLGDVLKHARDARWRRAIPVRRIWGAQALQLVGFLVFVAATSFIARDPQQVASSLGLRQEGSDTPQSAEVADPAVRVTPGHVEIERGTGLLVTAEFPRTVPTRVELVAVDAAQQEVRLPLVKSLDDPLFGARIPEVAADLTYHVEFDGRSSDDYQVTTFEFPRLEQADAQIKYPSYTGLADDHQQDVRRVSVVEGSELTLQFHLNKPVETALLNGDDARAIELLPVVSNAGEASSTKPDADQSSVMTATLSPQESQTFRLQLTDDQGRPAKEPVEFVVDVLPNQPPQIKIAFPARDLRVSPLQEVSLEGEAWDDFGLSEHGLILQRPDGSEEQLVLGNEAAANARAAMAHQIDLEPLGIAADELVSFYFYADDVGPDGQTRRAFSDMFFAEVRPFEELYRQAPNMPSQGQGGSPCKKLIQLQRQIVSGTWNLMRREPLDPPREKFPADATTLSDSQTQVKELAEQFAGTLEDLLMQQFAAEAIEHMDTAQQQFATAASTPSITPLPDGRDAARAAYQALLRLQAREHQVKNSQSQSSGQGEKQRRLNDQLKALELKNDRHRYETEQQARQQQDEAAREALQVLNRLRELARRQEDLNERIRQLENELRNAKSEQERQELQRQLKRLQEEQQELLRDVDELRERMNREENRPRMADAREALDKTRERVFQSAQALKEQQTSKAIAEGTRAQRELNELKEEFRQQTAGQFDESVRELRDQARDLAQKQEEIGRELSGEQQSASQSNERQRPSLRDTPQQDRTQIAEELAEQRERLQELLQQMRSLVEASETAEPLLSKRLYDAMRAARVDNPEEELAAAAELARRGFEQPARNAEQQARVGINKLKTGIEQAAESVLGNEEEALAQAREQLAMLTESIAEELARNDREFARERQQQQTPSEEGKQSQQSPSQQPAQGESPQKPSQSSQSNSSQSDQQQGKQEDNPGQPSQSGNQGQQQSEQRRQAGNKPDQQPQPGQQGTKPGEQGQRGEQGQQPGDQSQPGQQQGQASQQSSPQGKSGQKPGQQSQSGQQGQSGQGQQPGQQQGQQGRPGQGPSGQGQTNQNQSQPGQDQQSSPNPSQSATASGGNGGPQRSLSERLRTSLATETHGGGNAGPFDPLTGGEFLQWSDRMRDIEEMLSDPQLRSQAAEIRERAREMRIEFKRHSKQPNWDLVRMSVYGPMRELEQRLAEELARRTPDDELVPIDRDPVPDQYAELVKQYYEELSRLP